MKNEILSHLQDPRKLEQLYRGSKVSFKQAFNSIYPELKGQALADYWFERLNYETEDINWGNGRELAFILAVALAAGIGAKIPAMLNIPEDFFFPRNFSFLVLPMLMAFFAWKQKLPSQIMGILAAITLMCLLYTNLLPDLPNSDTLSLVFIHLPILLWGLLGWAFVGEKHRELGRRLDYLKYNGDLVVMTSLFLLAGGLMTGITLALFAVIGLHIEQFYFQNIVLFGLPAAPILGTYLIQSNPQLVGKVSPVIAKIFSPLVLAMLVIYLIAMAFSGKNPYQDREFLIIFNALLIGVLAIIFFSVAESTHKSSNRLQIWILLLLSTVTILVNGVALSAIVFRIMEWGITPNRLAVLGGNVLVLTNLLLVAFRLYNGIWKKENAGRVGEVIAWYLPVYCIWAFIVTFLFPIFFGLK